MTVFSKIIKGELPGHKVYEDDNYCAFLDINPVKPGHTLVVPKKEVDDVFDLSEDDYLGLMKVVKLIEPAVKKASGAKRVGLSVVGLEVPHAHIHLIPINTMGDYSFSNAKKSSNEALEKMAEKIKSYL
jgi:histidine triad (HIT) family protein